MKIHFGGSHDFQVQPNTLGVRFIRSIGFLRGVRLIAGLKTRVSMTSLANGVASVSPRQKLLLVFDFDNTFIEGNSDVLVFDLFKGGKEPEDLVFRSGMEWNPYMQRIFNALAAEGVGRAEYVRRLQQDRVRLMEGWEDLVAFIRNTHSDQVGDPWDITCAIASDANSFFIRTILEANQLTDLFPSQHIHTNPADFNDEDRLILGQYHSQGHSCKRCPANFCKGTVMDQYLSNFDLIVYAGDGSNDYCPIEKLRTQDAAFVRRGFSLHRILDKKQGQEARSLQCRWFLWKDFGDILNDLKGIIGIS